MFKKLRERFKEEDAKLVQEAMCLSRPGKRPGRNWPTAIFWLVVALAGAVLYVIVGRFHHA